MWASKDVSEFIDGCYPRGFRPLACRSVENGTRYRRTNARPVLDRHLCLCIDRITEDAGEIYLEIPHVSGSLKIEGVGRQSFGLFISEDRKGAGYAEVHDAAATCRDEATSFTGGGLGRRFPRTAIEEPAMIIGEPRYRALSATGIQLDPQVHRDLSGGHAKLDTSVDLLQAIFG
ncbi:hypothetical protein [Rhizobium herbae]